MNTLKTIEICSGILLMLSPLTESKAGTLTPDGLEIPVEAAQWDGPNLLDLLIFGNEQATPPTPVTGSYLAGLVVRQDSQANWILSEIGIQLYVDGERLDPRRYQVNWKVSVSPYSIAKARFVESALAGYTQKIQIEAPVNSTHGKLIGSIEIEAKIYDREQPEKAPEVLTQSLHEMLANGREGM